MDKLDALENLREELKRKVDLLIDEAINQVKEIIQADEIPLQKSKTLSLSSYNNKKNDEREFASEDSGSQVLDYSSLQVQQPIQSQITTKSTSNESTPLVKSLSLKDIENSTPLSKQSNIKSDSFISPVLKNRHKKGIKRDHEVLNKEVKNNDSLDELFSRNISCITPVKTIDNKKKSIKLENGNSTPPHFWSLDMPSSPSSL